MKTLQNFAFTAVAAVVLASSALAQNAVGAWNGHIKFTLPKEAMANPQTAAQVEQGLSMVKKMVFKLNLKADKTYTMKVEGAPGASAQKDNTDTGTWSQKGNAITFASTKSKNKGQTLPTLKLSSDGKAGTIDLPGAGTGTAQIVFSLAK